MHARPRILVVDPEDDLRAGLVDELSRGYRVEAATSGGDALDALSLQPYDGVISELEISDHDGIEVLEYARRNQRDAVRVLLATELDDRVRTALMRPEAPYRVAKAWPREVEVVLRRGLDERERARRLLASVQDALHLSTLDGELAAARTLIERCDVLVQRALALEGVTACAAVVRADGVLHTLCGALPAGGPGWLLDLPLDLDGCVRLRARGVTDSARQILHHMAHRTQRACGVFEPSPGSLRVLGLSPATRVNQLVRQATVGALTQSLFHDLASMMQALTASLAEVTAYARTEPALMAAAVEEASATGDEVAQLFIQMRKFIREGEVRRKRVRLDQIVARAVRVSGVYVRLRAELRIGALPEVLVEVSESLLLQVLANLLRNAADASPRPGAIDLEAHATDTEVAITVTDDGPGVPPEIADSMFETFAPETREGVGFGLAISAYVMQLLDGRISYRKAPERGASFRVTLPRAGRAEVPRDPSEPVQEPPATCRPPS